MEALSGQIFDVLNKLIVIRIEQNGFRNEQELMTYMSALSYMEKLIDYSKLQIEKLIKEESGSENEALKNETRGK